MPCVWFKRLAVCSLLGAALGPAQAADLTVEQIVERTAARAHWAQRHNRQTNFIYQKTTLTEELDGKGRAKTTKEKLLHFEGGVATLKEIKRNGKPIPLPASADAREGTANREHLAKTSGARRDDNWADYLNKELLARFDFELIGAEDIAGRATYLLKFKPKNDNLPVKQITYRLVNRLGEKVWVDAREFEIAKAEIELLDEVTMWGGVLGAMKKFSYDIERTRVDGVWFNRVSNFQVEGRKLFDSTRVRVTSETSNFRRNPAFNK